MSFRLREVLLGVAAVLAQWLVFSRLELWGVTPDVVLLYVALVAIRDGRLPGTAAGFAAGLAQDFLTAPHLLGLNTLLKTAMGFFIGIFRAEQGAALRLSPLVAFVGALMVAVVHHGAMAILLALDQDTRNQFLVVGLWLGGALYTALVALAGALLRARSSPSI